MNVFEGHIDKDEEGFQDAEDAAYVAGFEIHREATKTQQDTFRRHSYVSDTWQESVDILIEVVNRTS